MGSKKSSKTLKLPHKPPHKSSRGSDGRGYITVYLTDTQRERLEAAATLQGIGVSTFIRAKALLAIK